MSSSDAIFRWIALACLAGSLAISTWYRLRARRTGETIARRREPALLVAGRLLVALPLFAGIFVYLIHPPWMDWAAVPLPRWARWAGSALGALAVPGAFWVFCSLGGNVSETVLIKKSHELVRHGPYRWVRHPLYADGIVLVASIGLIASNGFILFFAAITLAGILLVVIPLEERALVAAFGDRYLEYQRKTGRLTPRLRRPA